MNKEFVTYNQALTLKELGFDEPCFGRWIEPTELSISAPADDEYCQKQHEFSWVALAPLYQQAFRWFREKHGWVGGVRNLDRKKPMIVADFVKDEDNLFMMWADNYEDAELKALKELIERINSKI